MDKLDEFLKTRYVPEMRSNLPHRIIEAAAQRGRDRAQVTLGWLETVLANLLVPRSALSFAMVLVLVLGVTLGSVASKTSQVDLGVDLGAVFLGVDVEQQDEGFML